MAITTPNMALTAWNSSSDYYNYQQLASNFIALDQHDHSPGNGVQIDGNTGIKDGTIPQSKLSSWTYRDSSIPGSALQSGAVTPAKTAIAPYARLDKSSYTLTQASDAASEPYPFNLTDNSFTVTPSTGGMGTASGQITISQTGIYAVSGSFIVTVNTANQIAGTNCGLTGIIRSNASLGSTSNQSSTNIAIGSSGFEYKAGQYPVNVSAITYIEAGKQLSFWYRSKLITSDGVATAYKSGTSGQKVLIWGDSSGNEPTYASTVVASSVMFMATYLGRYS